MAISLLFSTLIFSIIIYVRGVLGVPFDIINTLSIFGVYSIPFFILGTLVKKCLEEQLDDKKINKGIFLHCLWVAFFSTFLWYIALVTYTHFEELDGLFYIVLPPFAYGFFFVLNLMLSLMILWLEKRKGSHSFRKVSLVVLSISFILLIYGGWALAKNDGGAGCVNQEYLLERAMRDGPSVCFGASEEGFFYPVTEQEAFFVKIMAPARFFKHICQSRCLYSLAIESNDAELCNFVDDERDRAECYSLLQEKLLAKHVDESSCDTIPDDGPNSLKDECFLLLAEKIKSIELCEKIEAAGARAMCKRRVNLDLE